LIKFFLKNPEPRNIGKTFGVGIGKKIFQIADNVLSDEWRINETSPVHDRIYLKKIIQCQENNVFSDNSA